MINSNCEGKDRPEGRLRRKDFGVLAFFPILAAGPTVLSRILNVLLLILSIFLIIIVLIQRGRGGGLVGALGGVGGSSAFGSKAGDAFTRFTIYVAAIWIVLIMILVRIVQPEEGPAPQQQADPNESALVVPAEENRHG